MVENRKINILTDEVVGKISAGEVVERPASAVKELVENSIDSGAGSVEIEVGGAGRTLIRVADNGEGMSPEDAAVACSRHTTSKLSDIADLDDIATLGFRGEALSSISSVSKLDLITRSVSAEQGVHIYIEGGETRQTRPAGRAGGTTVEVRDLFFNVPARRKFLKSDRTELTEIVNVIGRFIISYPNIEFKLTHGEKCLLHATDGMSESDRIKLVLGADVSGEMVEIASLDGKYDIKGYASRPAATRKDRRSQMFFVNGRYVRSKLLGDAVYVAYRSLLERGRYPSCVLFLSVPSRDVDVNVHPTKLEVKFREDREVKDSVIHSIKRAFDRLKNEAPVVLPEEESIAIGISVSERHFENREEDPTAFVEAENQGEFTYDLSRKKEPVAAADITGPIFQTGGCYIVIKTDEGFAVVDQHAAHERIIYELFSKASDESPVEVQNLLFPVRVDLSAEESVVLEKAMPAFRTIGFHIEPFGERSFAIQAVPAVIKDRDVKTVVVDVLADLVSGDGAARPDLLDEVVKLAACRAAIKAGDVLSREEMLSLHAQLMRCDLPFTCPHGRPTMFDMTLSDLEKRFRRK